MTFAFWEYLLCRADDFVAPIQIAILLALFPRVNASASIGVVDAGEQRSTSDSREADVGRGGAGSSHARSGQVKFLTIVPLGDKQERMRTLGFR